MKWTANYKAAFILTHQRQKVSFQPEQVVILSTGRLHISSVLGLLLLLLSILVAK